MCITKCTIEKPEQMAACSGFSIFNNFYSFPDKRILKEVMAQLFSIGGKQYTYSSVSGDLTMECKKIAVARRSAQPPALTFRTRYS